MSTLQTTIPPNAPANEIHPTDLNLSAWIFERVREFVTGRVLEVSGGIGNLAPICLQNNVATDVISINLGDESFDENYAHLLASYDTVIALHIADQIARNRLLIINCKKLLKPGGHLVTRLPARTALYKGLDQGVKNWFARNMIFINMLLGKDSEIIKVRYFILEEKSNSNQTDSHLSSESITISAFNKWVPKFPTSTALDLCKIGLNIIVVVRKY